MHAECRQELFKRPAAVKKIDYNSIAQQQRGLSVDCSTCADRDYMYSLNECSHVSRIDNAVRSESMDCDATHWITTYCMQRFYVSFYNIWLECDRDMGWMLIVLSRQHASNDMRHNLFSLIRDLDLGWLELKVTKRPFWVKNIWIDLSWREKHDADKFIALS